MLRATEEFDTEEDMFLDDVFILRAEMNDVDDEDDDDWDLDAEDDDDLEELGDLDDWVADKDKDKDEDDDETGW